jgi:Histidine kinase-, DNA gyrase B-, and HSP90-like ATPase
MGRLRLALWPAGLLLGIAAEWGGWTDDPGGATLDLAVGLLLIGLGLVAWQRRGSSTVGPLMAASGFAWFLGNLAAWALYLHRGPLVQLVVSYPSGRLRSRLQWVVVAAGYVCAVVSPLARNDQVTILLAVAVCATALGRFLVASGPERRARASALGAAALVAVALTLGAAVGLAGVDADQQVLWAYEVVIGLVAAWLFTDLLWGRWTQATITGLVVDLGELGDAGPLRDRLARALGDPTLVVGYWLPADGRYVDEAGRPVELPIAGAGRAVTPIEQDGEPVAALVHDASVLGDPRLVADVAAAARLAVANVRLQAQVRSRVAEVAASRRRIVQAADTQRRGLERRLRRGAEQRLGRVAELLAGSGPPLAEVAVGLEAARVELREFARGVHPAALVEAGLAAAVAELAKRSPVPTEVTVPSGRLPAAVEAAAYFVCSEALANIAKYAQASQASVRLEIRDGVLGVEVADDGAGGADPAGGSGLRGLADRVEALGGRLGLDSPPGHGTRITAQLPLAEATGTGLLTTEAP